MEPLLWDTSIQRTPPSGCKENQFYSLSFGQAETSIYWPDVISTSSKSFLTRRIDFTILLLFAFLKKHHFSVGKSEFSSPIAKSTSPGLSDSTFFAPCLHTVDTKFGPGKTSTYSLNLLSLLKGHLYTRERDTFSGTRNLVLNSIQGTPQQSKRGWPQRGLISLSVHLSQWWQLSET